MFYAWNSDRTNYFTQSYVPNAYVSACGGFYATRVRRGEYAIRSREGAELARVASFVAMGRFLDSPVDCAFLGSVHSDDRATVWHGATKPAIVCGYHASRDDSMQEVYATLSTNA